MSEIPSELLEDFPFTPHVDAEELPVHDLTPEQLDRLQYLAIVRDGIDNRMNELMASLHEDTDASYHSFVRDAEMLRSASLEFMEHATALVEAARKLDRIRAIMDGDGSIMGDRDAIKEVLDGR